MPADKMPAANKPVLPPLQTPKSASFPSDLLKTPLSGVGCAIKQEEDLKTPITPPSAYTDFLKALTPILTSPHPLSALPRSLSDESSGSPSCQASFSGTAGAWLHWPAWQRPFGRQGVSSPHA